MQALPDDVRRVLNAITERFGVPTGDAHLLNQHSNTVIALPSARLAVRIAGNPEAFDRISQSVAITRWLTHRNYPCIEPANLDPFHVDEHVVSIWRLLDVVDKPPGTGIELGRLLRVLHDQPAPPFELRHMTDPLESVAHAAEHHLDAMSEPDRSWLLDQINDKRTGWRNLATALTQGLIHGDAHTNNLIRVRHADVVLGDWDHVAHGPREWDLIQPHYMQRRFGRHTEQDLNDFTTAYGWDVRTWPKFETLIHIRELSGLAPYIRKAPRDDRARREVAHRLNSLQTDDSTSTWNSPPRPAPDQGKPSP